MYNRIHPPEGKSKEKDEPESPLIKPQKEGRGGLRDTIIRVTPNLKKLKELKKKKEIPLLYHIMKRRQRSFKKVEIKQKEKKVAELKPEGKALFCFGPEHPFRKKIFNLAQNDYFQNCIIVAIVISTIALCFYDPFENPDNTLP